MAKKGQAFQNYTDEFKLKAVMKYINGNKSYAVLSEELGIKHCTQLKVWVKKWKAGEPFDTRSIGSGTNTNPLKGRPRTKFKSVEEERDYLKAQVEYLKKQYPNLIKGADIPRKLKYEIIEELSGMYPTRWLLEITNIKPGSYYKWRTTKASRQDKLNQDQDIKNHLLGVHLEYPEFGYPRMTAWLKEKDFVINHKKVYRLMKEMKIQSKIRKTSVI